MLIVNKFKSVLALVTVVASITACSQRPTVQEIPESASPHDEVSKLDRDINVAIQNQVNVLAPNNFKEAQSALKDSQKSLEKQRSTKDVLYSVALSRAYLNKANQFSALSRIKLEDVVIARQQAQKAGAPEILKSDFEITDEKFMDVTADIERNDFEDATKNRSQLQLNYLDLELRAIKHTRLGTARATVSKALSEGAKDFAPRSLVIAEKSIQDTDAYITANRHNEYEITSQSKETQRLAEHLLKITRDSKSGNKTSSEEMALRMEGEQGKVAAKEDQLEIKNYELAQGAKANRALASENKSLETDQALNERFEKARAEFSSAEAEVYKQGNTLMIRLRGLEFPSAQAVIKGSNFPLLAKVQRVIKSFGPTSVVVEGHTDSVGGKELNQKLSTERAQAVRDYLVSTNDGQTGKFQAVGYGYQKPLATNKTPNGRAQNRRVDIIIQAKGSSNSSLN